jgi:hypothetical protein
VSYVYGDCEWGTNAEIELQDCDCLNRSSRTHRRTRIVAKRDEKKNDSAKNDGTSHEVTEPIADAA